MINEVFFVVIFKGNNVVIGITIYNANNLNLKGQYIIMLVQ
mgnify:CR=1 FL=1